MNCPGTAWFAASRFESVSGMQIAAPVATGTSPGTLLVPRRHSLRKQTEECIREVYGREYDAILAELPETLIGAFDADGVPVCAAGLRFADTGFFSENYLDAPVEAVLAAQCGRPVRRERVFEVTTLVSGDPRAFLPFVREIVSFGQGHGFDWAFFTITNRLHALLHRVKLPLRFLGLAQPGRVERPERWGSYYLHDPRVCAVEGRLIAPLFPSTEGIRHDARTVCRVA